MTVTLRLSPDVVRLLRRLDPGDVAERFRRVDVLMPNVTVQIITEGHPLVFPGVLVVNAPELRAGTVQVDIASGGGKAA